MQVIAAVATNHIGGGAGDNEYADLTGNLIPQEVSKKILRTLLVTRRIQSCRRQFSEPQKAITSTWTRHASGTPLAALGATTAGACGGTGQADLPQLARSSLRTSSMNLMSSGFAPPPAKWP